MSALQAGLAPRFRVPLLVLGFLSLAAGISGGLVRLGASAIPAPELAPALHGVLMVAAFFGTVIGLERAVALGRLWAFAAPGASGLGGIVHLAGWHAAGGALLVIGMAVLVVANLAIVRRQVSIETLTLTAGSVCALVGNLVLALGQPIALAVPWWIGFFVLTIGGERLELSRYVPRPPIAQRLFVALAALVMLSAALGMQWPDTGWRLLGGALLALALWLYAFDIARKTVRQRALTRYIAVCLLSGYAWLGAAGAALLVWGALQAGAHYDAVLHAVFVGFVFSMVFGHGPVIFPAILPVRIAYHPLLYVPLVVLHASLLVRAAADLAGEAALRFAGSAGNAIAIGLYIVSMASLALRGRVRA